MVARRRGADAPKSALIVNPQTEALAAAAPPTVPPGPADLAELPRAGVARRSVCVRTLAGALVFGAVLALALAGCELFSECRPTDEQHLKCRRKMMDPGARAVGSMGTDGTCEDNEVICYAPDGRNQRLSELRVSDAGADGGTDCDAGDCPDAGAGD